MEKFNFQLSPLKLTHKDGYHAVYYEGELHKINYDVFNSLNILDLKFTPTEDGYKLTNKGVEIDDNIQLPHVSELLGDQLPPTEGDLVYYFHKSQEIYYRPKGQDIKSAEITDIKLKGSDLEITVKSEEGKEITVFHPVDKPAIELNVYENVSFFNSQFKATCNFSLEDPFKLTSDQIKSHYIKEQSPIVGDPSYMELFHLDNWGGGTHMIHYMGNFYKVDCEKFNELNIKNYHFEKIRSWDNSHTHQYGWTNYYLKKGKKDVNKVVVKLPVIPELLTDLSMNDEGLRCWKEWIPNRKGNFYQPKRKDISEAIGRVWMEDDTVKGYMERYNLMSVN